MSDLVLDRLDQLITRKQDEISQVEEILKSRRRELQELIYIRGGSDKGGEDNIAVLQGRKKGRPSNQTIKPWNPNEDQIILDFIEKLGTVGIGEAARQANGKLGDRTDGAIRQRIMKLVEQGYLRRKGNERPFSIELGRKKLEAA